MNPQTPFIDIYQWSQFPNKKANMVLENRISLSAVSKKHQGKKHGQKLFQNK